MVNYDIDADKALSLVHTEDSPTYSDELVRRINFYNHLRVRAIDYEIDKIRLAGINNSAFRLFKRELRSLPNFNELS